MPSAGSHRRAAGELGLVPHQIRPCLIAYATAWVRQGAFVQRQSEEEMLEEEETAR